MKTIGLIGGLSWESSSEYYRIINQTIQAELGGVHSAKIVMHSFDFQEVKDLQHADKWDELSSVMTVAAQNLKKAGADFIVICSNTMHKMADAVEAGAGLPVLHIADPTGEEIQKQGISKIALLGTDFTMTHDFYKGRLKSKFGLEVRIPNDHDRGVIHSTIYNELVKGIVRAASRENFARIIKKSADEGAEGIILGCTEIMLLVKPEDSSIPVFDTTIHFRNSAVPSPVWAVIEQYEADIRDIHSVFFRPSSIFCRHEMGPYITMKAPDLHGDYTTNPEEVIYTSRLNALQLLYFRDADILTLDYDEQFHVLELIEQARDTNFGIEAQKARRELIDNGYPGVLPLGAVAMMAPQVFDEYGNVLWKGTDHFSSDLPTDPAGQNLSVSSCFFQMALG